MKKFFTPTPEDEYLRKHMTCFVLAMLTSMLIVLIEAIIIAWIVHTVINYCNEY